jgi:DNA-binding response OmpR family regulator
MKTILLIDDAEHIADAIEYTLEEHGFKVLTASDAAGGLRKFRAARPQLVLLDLNLPDMSGLEVFLELKRIDRSLPVIMLTARVEEADRVLGLELGADDYITKPFSVRELAARVKVVLRRAEAPTQSSTIERGPLRIMPEEYQLSFHGQALKATRAEFDLLKTLAAHPAQVFSRDALIRAIYDDQHPVTDRSIDACVKRLRKKLLAIDAAIDPIETIYGVGYKLNQELREAGE